MTIAEYLDQATANMDSIRKNLEDQIAALQQYRKSLILEVVTG